jgi:hypothetical protein
MPIVRWLVSAAAILSVSAVVTGSARADGGVPNHTDGTAQATSLTWTAPGDDSLSGTAVGYDIRFSRSPITSTNFPQATKLNSMLLPGPPGTKQSFSFTGLTPGVTYYFAVKTVDEKGNWSTVSNIAQVVAGNVGVSPQISEPHFSSPWPNPARVGARFTVSLPKAEALRIEAFDVSGRMVRTLAKGEYSAGTFDLTWDLRDEHGQQLRTGVYLVRGQVGERVFLRRLSMVR